MYNYIEVEKSNTKLRKKRKKKPIPENFVSFARDIANSLQEDEDQSKNALRSGKRAKNKEMIVYVLRIQMYCIQ